MKATITYPSVREGSATAICTVIPFDTVKVSIALDNGVGERLGNWCTRTDFRVYDKKTEADITVKLFGRDNIRVGNGEELMSNLKVVSEYETKLAFHKF